MIAIGIDIAADTFTATAVRETFETLFFAQTFPQTPDGFAAFGDLLTRHAIAPDASRCLMEATGVYSERLSHTLAEGGWAVYVEPPLKVKKAFTERGKSDPVDSRQIAEYGIRFADKLHLWQPRERIVDALALLLTTREAVTHFQNSCKTTRKGLLRKQHADPALLTMYEEMIQEAAARIAAIDAQMDALIAMNPRLKQPVECLLTMPSIGRLLIINLLVVTEGFTRHVDARELASYLGICPFPYESGVSVRRRPQADGAGPARVRKLLYLAAMRLRTHHPEMRAYYERKTAAGKSGRLVLNNLANRTLRVMCGLLTAGQPYAPHYHSPKPC